MVLSIRAQSGFAGNEYNSASMHCLAVSTRAFPHTFEKPSDHVENITKVFSSLKEIFRNDLLSVVQSQIEAIINAHQSFQVRAIGELDRLDIRLNIVKNSENEARRATF